MDDSPLDSFFCDVDVFGIDSFYSVEDKNCNKHEDCYLIIKNVNMKCVHKCEMKCLNKLILCCLYFEYIYLYTHI